MDNAPTFTVFAGERLLVSGPQHEAALSIKVALRRGEPETILAFDDRTGRQVDFDLRGSDEEIAARLAPQPEAREETRRGRPKLGVVAREVTLLPRHWEWLAEQPGGASVTLRKLVDAARQSGGSQGSVRHAQEAADRFMSAMLGNQPGYEEASRALYAGDKGRFIELTEHWPRDLRDYTRRLAEPSHRAAA
ncbi:DUF2239 family protein [Pseudorhodoplanes sinuspersici]|uniref:Uncharacterized protein n=1 Tax=Pseudorhodoplanes sinuspersici TaxID=1235591 RepID=A0A1W6ZWT0_9HYPH|nr:DUF2239 family protein [Pseudorhodoplanes sinuspersici]ARQ01859.1 hypothetical protein CAK95_24260 [Pseudorhodoplanes sinuspersici]RKE73623.1 hypothetical protein DFP91_1516 [Pseudorhodoplanes sinuspersici]